MNIIQHSIGEKFTLLTTFPATHKFRVFRSFDGKYFNKASVKFEEYNPSLISSYEYSLFDHPTSPSLRMSRVNFLPKIPMDVVLEFVAPIVGVVGMERHLFGGFFDEGRPGLCIVFGRIYDPSGRPIPNARVEVAVNRDAYFVSTYSNVGPSTFTVTNEAGYFELPLVKNIQVTINIPAIGFVTTGYVPNKEAVELASNCLDRSR